MPMDDVAALRVRGKLFVRLHQDGQSLVVRVDAEERELLLSAKTETFFITDHYRDHPWILVNLATVDRPQLEAVLQNAWRLRAPKSLVTKVFGT